MNRKLIIILVIVLMSFTRIAFADDAKVEVTITECHEFVNEETSDIEQMKNENVLKIK